MNIVSNHNRLLRGAAIPTAGGDVYNSGWEYTPEGEISGYSGSAIYTGEGCQCDSAAIVDSAFNKSTAWVDEQNYLTAHQDITNLPYVQNSALDFSPQGLISGISGTGFYAASAEGALNAETANFAYNAEHADSADYANSAYSAEYSREAFHSTSADIAEGANHAESADFILEGWEFNENNNITGYNGSAFQAQGGDYSGISPIVVDNDERIISAKYALLGVQEPLYFVEDSETATVIGIHDSAFPTFEGTPDGKISAINGSALNADPVIDYSAGNNIDITDHVISVTGSVPSADRADYAVSATSSHFSHSAIAAGSAGSATYDNLGREITATYLTAVTGDNTPYSAGPNIDITDHVISGKDWGSDISAASSYAYEQATAQIPTELTGAYVPLSARTCTIGSANTAWGEALAQGTNNSADGDAFAQGLENSAKWSIAQGYRNIAETRSIAQGTENSANTDGFAQGEGNSAYSKSIAQGYGNTASVDALAQGYNNTAKNDSFAQGNGNSAYSNSFTQGFNNSANSDGFAQGSYNLAKDNSIAQGYGNSAYNYSQALGNKNIMSGTGMAIGQYNKTSANVAFVIGDGTAEDARSDLFLIFKDGSVSAKGNISASNISITNAPYVENTALESNGILISAISGSGFYATSAENAFEADHAYEADYVLSGWEYDDEDRISAYNGSAFAGQGGGIEYEGIAPIVVNNVEHKISAQSAKLGVQSPLYFVEDSVSATVIGISGLPEGQDIMYESALGLSAGTITSYNNSAFGGGGVQSDWTETATTNLAYIKHKPSEYNLVAGQNVTFTLAGNDLTIDAIGGGSTISYTTGSI